MTNSYSNITFSRMYDTNTRYCKSYNTGISSPIINYSMFNTGFICHLTKQFQQLDE